MIVTIPGTREHAGWAPVVAGLAPDRSFSAFSRSVEADADAADETAIVAGGDVGIIAGIAGNRAEGRRALGPFVEGPDLDLAGAGHGVGAAFHPGDGFVHVGYLP